MRILASLIMFAGCAPPPNYSVSGPCYRVSAAEYHQRTGVHMLVHSVELCPVERSP